MDTLKIGKFIAACRKEKGLTQAKLAEMLGVTAKTISRWENGNYIISFNLNSFLMITTKQVSDILRLYENKEQIKTFSPVYFSQHMYNITGLNDSESNALAFAHQNVISPIAEHYVSNFNIRYADVSVDALNDGYIGKTIDLSISGIKNSRIIADIEKNIFGITQYLYKYYLTSEGFVRIIVR